MTLSRRRFPVFTGRAGHARPLFASLAGGCVLLSSLALAGPPAITPLVLEGDAVSGAGLVTTINNLAVNDSGDWLVEVDTDAATNDVALIRNGIVIINEGDSMPATPPRATLSSFDSITLNNAGESGYNFVLGNTGATTNDSGVYFGPPPAPPPPPAACISDRAFRPSIPCWCIRKAKRRRCSRPARRSSGSSMSRSITTARSW
jgi:hypothetical protein